MSGCRRFPQVGSLIVGGFSALLLGLAGCAQSPCERMEAADKSLIEKTKACSEGTPSSPEFSVKACEEQISACSKEDLDNMNKMLDCIEAMPACEKGKEMEFFGKMFECATHSSKLSAAC